MVTDKLLSQQNIFTSRAAFYTMTYKRRITLDLLCILVKLIKELHMKDISKVYLSKVYLPLSMVDRSKSCTWNKKVNHQTQLTCETMHFYRVKNDCADLPASASEQLLLNYFSGDEVFEPNFPDFLFVRAFYYCSKRFFVEHTLNEKLCFIKVRSKMHHQPWVLTCAKSQIRLL